MTVTSKDFSQEELILIQAISPHFYSLIMDEMGLEIIPMYNILAQQAFIENKQGPEVEALRRVCNAIQNCKPYRRTKEFDQLCNF